MAISLNGSTQYLSRASIVASSSTVMPITISCWFSKATLTGTATLVQLTSNSLSINNCYYLVAWGSDHGFTNKVGASYDNGMTAAYALTTSTYSANTLHHACARFDTENSRSVFLNGGSKHTETTAISPFSLSNGETNIGCFWSDSANSRVTYHNGTISEIGIWNVSLSDEEIFLLSKGFSPSLIRPNGLIAYYPLGGIYGRNSKDVWKNSYIMTEYGTPTYTDHPRVIYKQPGRHSTLSLPTPSRTLLYIPAYNFTFPSSSGAYFSIRNSIPIIVFDGTTSTSCITLIDIPTNYSGGQFVATLYVVTESATSGNISFDVGIEKIGDRALDLDSNNLTTKKGYFNEVSTTSGHVHQIKIPFSFSQFGSISPGETVSMKITRSTANDSITTNVGLLGVEIGEI